MQPRQVQRQLNVNSGADNAAGSSTSTVTLLPQTLHPRKLRYRCFWHQLPSELLRGSAPAFSV